MIPSKPKCWFLGPILYFPFNCFPKFFRRHPVDVFSWFYWLTSFVSFLKRDCTLDFRFSFLLIKLVLINKIVLINSCYISLSYSILICPVSGSLLMYLFFFFLFRLQTKGSSCSHGYHILPWQVWAGSYRMPWSLTIILWLKYSGLYCAQRFCSFYLLDLELGRWWKYVHIDSIFVLL